MMGNKKTNAQNFIKKCIEKNWKFLSGYSGKLTEHMSFHESLDFIDRLLQLKPGAIRSTSFILEVTGLQWKGTQEASGCTGNLYFYDFKAFKRKQRFHMGVTLLCRGSGKNAS